MTLTELLVGLTIAVGIVGIVVPVLPGSVLVVAAVLVWAWSVGDATGWVIFAVCTTLVAVGAVIKYAVPGRRLNDAGIPVSTLWTGAVLGIVGFFVIPVVGLPLGFLLGVYLAEVRRVGSRQAWPSTVHSLKAVGLSILIELAAAMLAALVWVTGVVLT